MSSFHFDVDELNVSINRHEKTPPDRRFKPEHIQTIAVGSTFEKSSSTDFFNSKSTRKHRDDSKEISKITSKNLIAEFDKTSDSYQKIKNSKTVRNYEIISSGSKTKERQRSKVLASKIRIFNTKFIHRDDFTPVVDSFKEDSKIYEIWNIPAKKPDKIDRSSKHILKYKAKIQYGCKKQSPQKSRNFRPFIYNESDALQSSRTTNNFYTREPSKISEEKKTIKLHYKSPVIKRYTQSKLNNKNTKSTHNLHQSKMSVRSIKDKVSRRTNGSVNSRNLMTDRSNFKSSQRTNSQSVFDRLMNDVKKRHDIRNSSVQSKIDSSRKSSNDRSIHLSVRAFRPTRSRNSKLNSVASYIKSESQNRINSKLYSKIFLRQFQVKKSGCKVQ